MIDSNAAKKILIQAKKSIEKTNESIRLFKDFLEASEIPDQQEYYLARNRLKEGRDLLDEALAEAKIFLGPRTEYAPAEVSERRLELLLAAQVIVHSQTLEGLEEELCSDDFLKSFMAPDEIVSYLEGNIEKQQTGKRKLRNIKVRMIIDRIISLEKEGEALQQQAAEKIKAKP